MRCAELVCEESEGLMKLLAHAGRHGGKLRVLPSGTAFVMILAALLTLLLLLFVSVEAR